jgi:hypothetical protein
MTTAITWSDVFRRFAYRLFQLEQMLSAGRTEHSSLADSNHNYINNFR